MLNNKRQNFHHSKLPNIGEIGHITNGQNRYGETLYINGLKEPYIVESFPLCDNVRPYSFGIHTAHFRNLKTGERKQFSGFYFETI